MKLRNKLSVGCLLLITSLTSVSCKKFLDINTSPLTATEVEPKLLFGYAITAWDANKNSGDAWMPIALMTQNISSGGNFGWGADNLYNVSPYSIGNTWKVYYSTAGNNLKLAIKAAEAAVPANNNAAAQSKIVLAQLMYEATTLYGDVPFSEAWDADKFAYPKYDAQKDVFDSIIALLEEAKSQIDVGSPLKIADYDIYYKGDMEKWIKLANSIKFKTLMVMVDKDPSKAAAIGQMLQDPSSMISAENESWLHTYSNAANNENPRFRLFKTYTGGENQWFFANSFVFDYMEPKDDPRISKYFDLGPKATDFKAVGTELEADSTTSLISAYLFRAAAPSVILSFQEILFLQAEAYARGLGVAQNLATAQQLYTNGVEAAMKFYEVDATAISTYITNNLTDLTTAANPVTEIHIQQWIDLMDRPMEAFVQWRRSGTDGNEVPALTLPPRATAGPLIRRFVYSNDEVAANPNVPNPMPRYFEKMWFDL